MALKALREYPVDTWKDFKIYYTGGISTTCKITAPNKTYARMFFVGEHYPWHKITRIEEVVNK